MNEFKSSVAWPDSGAPPDKSMSLSGKGGTYFERYLIKFKSNCLLLSCSYL